MAEQPTELPLQTVVRFHQRRAEDYGDWHTTRSRRPGGIGDRRDFSLASAGQPSPTTANERRQRQRELAYGFAEGRGTTYSSFVPVGKSGKNAKWYSIIIANGEETSDELAMHAGEIRMAGETVRWIDLPVAKVGCPDAFDRARPFDSAAKRSVWFGNNARRFVTAADVITEGRTGISSGGSSGDAGRSGVSSLRYVTYL